MHPCLPPPPPPPPPGKFSITIVSNFSWVLQLSHEEDNGYEKSLGVSKLHYGLYGNAEQLFLV